jgi:hypothetical protein
MLFLLLSNCVRSDSLLKKLVENVTEDPLMSKNQYRKVLSAASSQSDLFSGYEEITLADELQLATISYKLFRSLCLKFSNGRRTLFKAASDRYRRYGIRWLRLQYEKEYAESLKMVENLREDMFINQIIRTTEFVDDLLCIAYLYNWENTKKSFAISIRKRIATSTTLSPYLTHHLLQLEAIDNASDDEAVSLDILKDLEDIKPIIKYEPLLNFSSLSFLSFDRLLSDSPIIRKSVVFEFIECFVANTSLSQLNRITNSHPTWISLLKGTVNLVPGTTFYSDAVFHRRVENQLMLLLSTWGDVKTENLKIILFHLSKIFGLLNESASLSVFEMTRIQHFTYQGSQAQLDEDHVMEEFYSGKSELYIEYCRFRNKLLLLFSSKAVSNKSAAIIFGFIAETAVYVDNIEFYLYGYPQVIKEKLGQLYGLVEILNIFHELSYLLSLITARIGLEKLPSREFELISLKELKAIQKELHR